jgi:L-lactate dehydrogenase complex protein LldG
MAGTIQNRDKFLNQIASSLERPRISSPVERPTWKFQPQYEVLKEATQDDLLEVLTEQCKKIHTNLYVTDSKDLATTLNEVVSGYGGGPIITWKDERFSQWGLDPLLKKEWPAQNIEVYEWNHVKGKENIAKAEKANVGITISEVTLAESGTVVLYSDDGQLFTGNLYCPYSKKHISSTNHPSGSKDAANSQGNWSCCLMYQLYYRTK